MLRLIIIISLWSTGVFAEGTSQKIWDVDALSKPPQFRWVDDTSPIRSLIFTGPEYRGLPSEVFAFYATPGTVSGDAAKDKDLPAVVCLHGGGGTAFAEWVNLWARRGYAAIALDFSGRRPNPPQFEEKTHELIVQRNHRDITRERLEHGGPEQGSDDKFAHAGGDLSDDWQYHAISNILSAHSLIRSFPEVDENRTAVTGISWGGYLTCVTAGVDSRFKAAVPVYGCGFLYEGESVQKPMIDRLPDVTRDTWINMYDPSRHLANCRVPILFVNGTNDVHYPLDSYMKSFDVVPGEKNLRIEVKMAHSHPAGWQPDEIERFIGSKINGLPSMANVKQPKRVGGQVTAMVNSDVPISSAAIHWTTDGGKLSDRGWNTTGATVENHVVTGAAPPMDATIWYVTVTDELGAMTSSRMVFEKL